MKNEQIFEILAVQNQPSNNRALVLYELEGERKEESISYERLIKHIGKFIPTKLFREMSGKFAQEVKLEAEDLGLLPDEAIEEHVKNCLFKELRVDLIIKLRKAEDKIEDLNERLSKVRTGVLLMKSVLIDTFQKYHEEGFMYSDEHRAAQQTMCSQTIYHATDCVRWFEEKVIQEVRGSENRMSA